METKGREPAMTADDLPLTMRDGALIASPAFEIDLSTAESLADRVVTAISADCRGVILDLTQVDFIDSYGIYVLVGLSNRLVDLGRSLALVVPPGSPVMSTLQVSNLQQLLPVRRSVDDALATLAGLPPT
jgi:anti-anti-sigma factor